MLLVRDVILLRRSDEIIMAGAINLTGIASIFFNKAIE